VSDFQSALDSVLGTLEQIRTGGGRLPRASRAALEALSRPAAPTAEFVTAPPPSDRPLTKADRLAPVRARVLVCTRCPHLAASRTQTVFGIGNPDAEVMFIGEAPGADEDAQGEPFVGRAGQLLTKIIKAMGFDREEVYIANVLKCRPDTPGAASGNRPPSLAEMQTCLPYLAEQIEIVQPKVLVALGATAVEGLLGTRGPMRDLRGKWHSYEETPLMITYHPSYLLRNQTPAEKRKVWEDMLLVLERIGSPISEKQRRYFL
jgi:DNA polymerase